MSDPLENQPMTAGLLRSWGPVVAALAVALSSGVLGYAKLVSADEAQAVSSAEIRAGCADIRRRVESLEKTQEDIRASLQDTNTSVKLLLCRVSPRDCPLPK